MEKYKILEIDPYLANYAGDINLRMERYFALKKRLTANETLLDFADAYEFYGIHKIDGGYIYREWAPNAKAMFFLGDFNGWNNSATPMHSIGNGNWEVIVPFNLLNTYVKVRVIADNYDMERIPLYIQYVARDEHYAMTAKIIDSDYTFKNRNFKRSKNPPVIYECHIGMAQEKEGVGTYEEFRVNILPKIKEMGFNTIQLMGIMEHPYYGSFGYQVSNFFAPSSLFGTPTDLKKLVDEAHGMGIAVLLDIVHAHAVKNTLEGINLFDGTEGQFFLCDHPAWGTKIFDYSKDGVLQFLLSNVKYYLKELNFDGFRFDGVTSMLYTHYGLGTAFDSYDKYFSMSTNIDAINYLQLATDVAHLIKPDCLMISEDMSGMPGMCLPVSYGGIGFDYRLMMGTPDMWIKLIDDTSDENWSMNNIYYELSSRRPQEKAIGYAESHDQALVGDKTVIFRLIDKEMYWHMLKPDENILVDRGIALYKLIYAVTMTLGGNGYLNFMGNEFGHPEWIDFPREGNGQSYKYARRQWSLAENKSLKYDYLKQFNKELISLVNENNVLENFDKQIFLDENLKVIAYRKKDLLFVMSFHYHYSPTDLFLQLNEKVDATLIFSSDEPQFGGFNRLKIGEKHKTIKNGSADGVRIYLPCRTFNVFKLTQSTQISK